MGLILVHKEENTMIDYKKMYAILCTAASEAIDILPNSTENLKARIELETALRKTEEMYISQSEYPAHLEKQMNTNRS